MYRGVAGGASESVGSNADTAQNSDRCELLLFIAVPQSTAARCFQSDTCMSLGYSPVSCS